MRQSDNGMRIDVLLANYLIQWQWTREDEKMKCWVGNYFISLFLRVLVEGVEPGNSGSSFNKEIQSSPLVGQKYVLSKFYNSVLRVGNSLW